MCTMLCFIRYCMPNHSRNLCLSHNTHTHIGFVNAKNRMNEKQMKSNQIHEDSIVRKIHMELLRVEPQSKERTRRKYEKCIAPHRLMQNETLALKLIIQIGMWKRLSCIDYFNKRKWTMRNRMDWTMKSEWVFDENRLPKNSKLLIFVIQLNRFGWEKNFIVSRRY